LVAAAHLDSVHHLIEAPAAAGRAAEDSAGRQPDAVEHHLGGLDALVAHLVDLAGDGQARPGLAEPGLLLDQERGHVLVGRAAVVSHIFWPSRTNPPSAARARVLMAATSEPHSGSLIENAPRISPLAIFGSSRCCCSCVPC
jgi:hypothetical protein